MTTANENSKNMSSPINSNSNNRILNDASGLLPVAEYEESPQPSIPKKMTSIGDKSSHDGATTNKSSRR